MGVERHQIRVKGIVQGVGFRPFVHRLARERGLAGFVRNDSRGVLIEIEGDPALLNDFAICLHCQAPPLSRITETEVVNVAPNRDREFVIRISDRDSLTRTLISPDVSVCPDCLRELFDPGDRRYGYPFTNCTNCGPRFTIVREIPYDRAKTSMSVFEMCPDCQREYDDPADRRFHAQPNGCFECGPHLWLFNTANGEINSHEPVQEAVRQLANGKVVGIRGIGGFHLAVSPFDDEAVKLLRRRKGREEKPFAMMAADPEAIREFVLISPEEERLLLDAARPIVLLKARPGNRIAPSVAPGCNSLGFMLPNSPLHYLILQGNFPALIMTSGNFSEEPIAIGNEEAVERLSGLADCLLLHNREILKRCDDSVTRVMDGGVRILRRSRGFVPCPVFLRRPIRQGILACGGELKNTIAISRAEEVFLSQHIGDLDNCAAFEFFEESVRNLTEILETEPQYIAFDLHPEYLSTKWAVRQNLPAVGVQHHHAHLASVMAENGVEERSIGIILDGTGYGLDGTVWGGEVLVGDYRGFERFAWLRPVPMPGGAAAIRHPWRMGVAMLVDAFGPELEEFSIPFLERVDLMELNVVNRMLARRINSPLTSSCGRLFDAVAALLGVRNSVKYEAQAAVELETLAGSLDNGAYGDVISGAERMGAISTGPLVREIVSELRRSVPAGRIASRFHTTLAEVFARSCEAAAERFGIGRIGLSGGVFQNVKFFEYLTRRLDTLGFEVLTHRQVPTNDGGLALGQVLVADARLSAPANGL